MNPEEFHEDVGSSIFEFIHSRPGSLTRMTFQIKFGENPDAWKARLLMPGAEFMGVTHAVFEVDTGAVTDEHLEGYRALIFAGRSAFTFVLHAATPDDFMAMCREIGAVPYHGRPFTRWLAFKCVVRWFWERRPVCRWRSPLDAIGR